MPSEAEIEAGARALATRELGMGDAPGVVASVVEGRWREYRDTARAALSAASAVRSEPVAWIVHDDAELGDYLTKSREAADRSGKRVTPLYTSPVQTREDGPRIKPEIIAALREWAEFEQDGGNVEQGAAIDIILDWYDRALSQPEPRGDKA